MNADDMSVVVDGIMGAVLQLTDERLRAALKTAEAEHRGYVNAYGAGLLSTLKEARPAVRKSAVATLAGERGPEGPAGPEGPMGEMPQHEWDGTRIRFERAPGEWGPWVDLEGRRGQNGGMLMPAAVQLDLDGGTAAGDGFVLDGGGASSVYPMFGIDGGGAAAGAGGTAFNAGRSH